MKWVCNLKSHRCNKVAFNCNYNTRVFTKLPQNILGIIKYNLSKKIENGHVCYFSLNRQVMDMFRFQSINYILNPSVPDLIETAPLHWFQPYLMSHSLNRFPWLCSIDFYLNFFRNLLIIKIPNIACEDFPSSISLKRIHNSSDYKWRREICFKRSLVLSLHFSKLQ